MLNTNTLIKGYIRFMRIRDFNQIKVNGKKLNPTLLRDEIDKEFGASMGFIPQMYKDFWEMYTLTRSKQN